MCPILISVSVAPVSYFFCASAGPAQAKARPSIAVGSRWSAGRVIGFRPMFSAGSLQEPVEHEANRPPESRRQQINDQNQNDTENCAGQALGHLLGDIGHEEIGRAS